MSESPDEPEISKLLSQLLAGRGNQRVRAAWRLRRFNEPHVVEALCRAVREDRWEDVRATAAQSLAECGDATATESLIDALACRCDYVQSAAMQALGEVGDLRAVAPLVSRLRSPWDEIEVARALGRVARRYPGEGAVFAPAEELVAALAEKGLDYDIFLTDALAAIRDAVSAGRTLPLPASGSETSALDLPIASAESEPERDAV